MVLYFRDQCMKNIKQYLAESDYSLARSGTSIPGDFDAVDAEMAKRLKLLNYDHNAAMEFQIPFKDYWSGEELGQVKYERHVSLVDPNYVHRNGELNLQDPGTILSNIELYKKDPNSVPSLKPDFMSNSGSTSARIASMTQAMKDAEHFQKIKSQIPQLLKQGSKGNSPGTSAKSDPKVKELQDRILAKDPNALPKFGADGVMGKETRAAMQRLGITESLELQRILDIAKF